MTEPDPDAAPLLKEIFNPARLRHIADQTAAVHPAFDSQAFLAAAGAGLEGLSLMQRLTRVSESLHATLPADYPAALKILRALAPRLNSGFVTMALPEFVALYGQAHWDLSLDALKFFTGFGSSEFAIRHFLRRDLARGLAALAAWSLDENEHVRRLASEGSRPRLPWSFRLQPLVDDPSPVAPILDNLRRDPSPYVRKSVANHLNDITKDNPDWALDRIGRWSLDDARTGWIARHALRTLIKKGDRRALQMVGAGETAEIEIGDFRLMPAALTLGQTLTISFTLRSTAPTSQTLVVDYAVHYVKKSGALSAKVFKLKRLTLAPGETVDISRRQAFQDFTTRVHHAGRHGVEILVNGEAKASATFELQV